MHHRVGQLRGDRLVRRALGEQGAQRGAPADVGEPAERPARLGRAARPGSCRTRRSRGPSSRSATSCAARPSTPGRASRSLRGLRAGLRHLGGPGLAGAVVAAAARGRLGVVELAAQELHPAPVRRLVVEHRLLLARRAPWPPARSAPRRRPTAGRWPPSRRRCGSPRRPRRAPSASTRAVPGTGRRASRARRSTAAARRPPGTSSVARTWRSGGKASEAKYAQMSRSSRPGSSTTSARSTPRPARPICW